MFKVLILVALVAQNVYQSNGAAACQNGQLYPHESECSKFYQCANGKLEEISCAETLEFSEQLLTCTYADQSGCQLNKGNGGESNNGNYPCNTTTPTPCPTSPSTCTPSPTTCTATSPTTCTPSPTTCTPRPTTCTTSPSTCTTPPTTCTTTSPTTCTPSPTTCTPRPTTCTTNTPSTCTPSPTPTCSTPPPTPPCTDPPAIKIQQPYPGCPSGVADPHHDTLLPLPKCCQFVHCDNFGVGHVKNCAPSDPPLVFSPCQNRCVWPWEAVNITCDPCTC